MWTQSPRTHRTSPLHVQLGSSVSLVCLQQNSIAQTDTRIFKHYWSLYWKSWVVVTRLSLCVGPVLSPSSWSFSLSKLVHSCTHHALHSFLAGLARRSTVVVASRTFFMVFFLLLPPFRKIKMKYLNLLIQIKRESFALAQIDFTQLLPFAVSALCCLCGQLQAERTCLSKASCWAATVHPWACKCIPGQPVQVEDRREMGPEAVGV